MAKKAENQKFQDLVASAMGPEILTLEILPHIHIHLNGEEVENLMSMMQKASSASATYDDQHVWTKTVGVDRMKDDNKITFGEFVEIDSLTDLQWRNIYRVLREWQAWASKQTSEDTGDWRVQISPNRDAYALWDGSLSEDEKDAMVKRNWENIFNKDAIDLS